MNRVRATVARATATSPLYDIERFTRGFERGLDLADANARRGERMQDIIV